jgi:hypothetical protein
MPGPGFSCLWWTSFASMDTLFTFPGVWTAYAIMNGDLIATESVTVTTTPVFNQPPDSTLAHDVIYGPAPLTVNMKLSVTGDNEGDAVDATWHIPTVGEIALNSGNFPGSAGVDSQTFTFDTPGEYQVYVEVNDDWTRYGSGGSAAGPGFRTLYRRVVRVTSVSDDITTFADTSGDGVPDLAGFVGAYSKKPKIAIYSGANGNVDSKIYYFTTNWRGIAIGTVKNADQDVNADDPAVAMLADSKTSGKISVQIRRLDTGASLGKIAFLNSKWRAIDVAVIDDTNGDGDTDDTSIAVLAQNKVNGKIRVQIRSLGSGALVNNIDFLNESWTAIAIAVVDRSAQVPMGGLPPLIGLLAENNVNGKRYLQSRLVSTGALDGNIKVFNSNWNLRDVSVLYDVDGPGPDTDSAWQVLATRQSDGLLRVQTRLTSDGSLDSNVDILNSNWDGIRLDSALDMNSNAWEEFAVSARKRSDDTRRIQIKDYGTGSATLNIYP